MQQQQNQRSPVYLRYNHMYTCSSLFQHYKIVILKILSLELFLKRFVKSTCKCIDLHLINFDPRLVSQKLCNFLCTLNCNFFKNTYGTVAPKSSIRILLAGSYRPAARLIHSCFISLIYFIEFLIMKLYSTDTL